MTVDSPYRARHGDLVPPNGTDLHAQDLTATFAADVTLADAQRRLGEIDQWLPVDGSPDAALGELVSFNSTGPLRLGYGAWRDLLLGLQFTNGRGELITAGGRTVKNVAGYDLTKFMVGQRGVFGRIVTLTTRTYRRPAGAVLVRHGPRYTTLSKLLTTPLRPQWAVLTRDELLCGYLADATTLDWYEANVHASGPINVYRRPLEVDIEHRASLWKQSVDGAAGTVFRASVPPSKVQSFAEAARAGRWTADAAFGVVIGTVTSAEAALAVRDAAQALGGAASFGGEHKGPHDALPVAFFASTNPVERRIIERLKAAFDPDNKLSPLPWQTR